MLTQKKSDWVHVSMPKYPTEKYLFWNDGIYEIKSFYKRPHGADNERNFEEDISWTVSLGLKKFDWTGANVCWRLSCKNAAQGEAGKELLLKALALKDDRAAFFNACKALKEIKNELQHFKYEELSEFRGKGADEAYDKLRLVISISDDFRRTVIEDEEGNVVFADYTPGSVLALRLVRKEYVNDDLRTLIAALDIHRRTIKMTKARLTNSDIFIAVKKKGYCH